MMKFKNGAGLAEFVKTQVNVIIKVDTTFKERKGVCYMEIPNSLSVLTLLAKNNIRIENHLKNRYFVYLV